MRPLLDLSHRNAASSRRSWPATLVLLLSLAATARAQSVPDSFTVETLAPGLSAPVAIEFLPDGRVLYAEQFTARVRLFAEGVGVQAAPVLSVQGVAAGGERGLLGLAVDPGYPARPYLYLFYDVATPNHIRIARYTLAGNLDGQGAGDLTADAGSRYDLLDDIPDLASNHNGGTLRFGLEGLLYASIGEDGIACAAQDSVSLRGVIVRLRTDALPPGPGAAFRAQLAPSDNPYAASADSNLRLVAALGLRNPFRFQIDPVFGRLVIGDVGENLREELDLLSPPVVTTQGGSLGAFGDAPLGADFGWPYLEGTEFGTHRDDCGPVPANLAAPVFDYDRTTQQGGAAIISAGLYFALTGRSRNWPATYSGDLFANDYYSGVLRRLKLTNGAWVIPPAVPGQPSSEAWGSGFSEVSDWRIGPDGALWYCRQSVGFAPNTGSLGRIAGPGGPPPPPPPPPPPLELAVLGSPAVGSCSFRLALDLSRPSRLTLHDLSGRLLRSWGSDEYLRGREELRVNWDGRDADGNAMRPGMYVARLESAGRSVAVRIPFLR